MPQIRPATPADYLTVERIAHQTWPNTYRSILSAEQFDHMLHWMYSPEAIAEQIEQKNHVFLMAVSDAGETVGYVSYELDYVRDDISFGETTSLKITKIHKLYLLPQTQGQGIGRLLIDEVAQRALAAGNTALGLNVNRQNRAVQFYERMGFSIITSEDIDIGNGFLMEDFVMQKPLTP